MSIGETESGSDCTKGTAPKLAASGCAGRERGQANRLPHPASKGWLIW